jgi:DNA repair exonuclease SbcCD nuclease subunit
MTTRFLHSADWQLGKPFATVGDEVKRHRLQVERVQVIRRMAAVVAERALDFVVVAGDLFDSPHVTKATVSAACEAMGLMRVPVLVIPGNHDHGGPGSIWEQAFFRREREQLAPNLRVLLKGEPVVLEKAVVFPAPLLRRHEAGNPVAWVREGLDDAGVPGELPRIVVAHGTVQGFGGVEDERGGERGFWGGGGKRGRTE